MPRKLLDKTFETKSGTDIFLNEHKEFQPIELKQWTDILYDDKAIKKKTFTTIYHWYFLLTGEYPDVSDYESDKKIKLDNKHILLLAFLIGYAEINFENECFYGSNKTLAEISGISDRSVDRYLSSLEKAGFITRSIMNNNKRRIYVNFARMEYWIYLKAGFDCSSQTDEKIRENYIMKLEKNKAFKTETQKEKFIEAFTRELAVIDGYQGTTEMLQGEKLCEYVAKDLIISKNKSDSKKKKKEER